MFQPNGPKVYTSLPHITHHVLRRIEIETMEKSYVFHLGQARHSCQSTLDEEVALRAVHGVHGVHGEAVPLEFARKAQEQEEAELVGPALVAALDAEMALDAEVASPLHAILQLVQQEEAEEEESGGDWVKVEQIQLEKEKKEKEREKKKKGNALRHLL
jgi:hypothetical protein